MNKEISEINEKIEELEEKVLERTDDITPLEECSETEENVLEFFEEPNVELSTCRCTGGCGSNYSYGHCRCSGSCGSNYHK